MSFSREKAKGQRSGVARGRVGETARKFGGMTTGCPGKASGRFAQGAATKGINGSAGTVRRSNGSSQFTETQGERPTGMKGGMRRPGVGRGRF